MHTQVELEVGADPGRLQPPPSPRGGGERLEICGDALPPDEAERSGSAEAEGSGRLTRQRRPVVRKRSTPVASSSSGLGAELEVRTVARRRISSAAFSSPARIRRWKRRSRGSDLRPRGFRRLPRALAAVATCGRSRRAATVVGKLRRRGAVAATRCDRPSRAVLAGADVLYECEVAAQSSSQQASQRVHITLLLPRPPSSSLGSSSSS
jgi:hypothetical protein